MADQRRKPPDGVADTAYTIKEAAALKSVSYATIHRAIHAQPPWPWLEAKKIGRQYRISATALEAWWERLPDA